MLKKLSLCLLLLSFLPGIVLAQSSWKDRKSVWEPLLQDKTRIALMTGGDLNGDYIDDVAVIYRDGPQQGLTVLISDRDDYISRRFEGNRLDLVYNTELAQTQALWIRSGRLELLCPFNGRKLVSDITANEPAAITFKFLENSVKLTDIVYNATLEQDHAKAQVWFDAAIGQVYVEYLGEAEKVGGKRLYYFRYYYRFAAYPIKNAALDCQDDEWVLFSYPGYLKNSPVGNPITYGFEKWTSDFDISAKMYAGYDQEQLYFFIEVYDDLFSQAYSGDKMLRGDHIELWFASADGEKVQIGVSPGNFAEFAPEARLWYQGQRPVSEYPLPEIAIAAKLTDQGYLLEFAVPFALLPQGYKKIGSALFSITISDSDQEGKQEKLLSSSSLKWGESHSLGELIFQK
ncbi:TM1410 hypothetical-related protein [Candidatus Vecturithrix granuli]|uniref:TM1410 hypothetical-related protein n=1 Tax=Vecturithrix granuli TaxID=1499967 RepID=A0A081C599_VECG1|nr:TM1410 hypothetical-related protein [Candidatus Vecturithrix granuli]